MGAVRADTARARVKRPRPLAAPAPSDGRGSSRGLDGEALAREPPAPRLSSPCRARLAGTPRGHAPSPRTPSIGDVCIASVSRRGLCFAPGDTRCPTTLWTTGLRSGWFREEPEPGARRGLLRLVRDEVPNLELLKRVRGDDLARIPLETAVTGPNGRRPFRQAIPGTSWGMTRAASMGKCG